MGKRRDELDEKYGNRGRDDARSGRDMEPPHSKLEEILDKQSGDDNRAYREAFRDEKSRR